MANIQTPIRLIKVKEFKDIISELEALP
jgi:hypothetical protein